MIRVLREETSYSEFIDHEFLGLNFLNNNDKGYYCRHQISGGQAFFPFSNINVRIRKIYRDEYYSIFSFDTFNELCDWLNK